MRLKRGKRQGSRRLLLCVALSCVLPALIICLRLTTTTTTTATVVGEESVRTFYRVRGIDVNNNKPTVYIATWLHSHRISLQDCIARRIPDEASTTSIRAVVTDNVKRFGYAEANLRQLDDLLTQKFSKYSRRVYNASHADFFYIPLPLSMVVDCMRAANDEERAKGIPRHRRSYPKTATFYTNALYSDLVNSQEYVHFTSLHFFFLSHFPIAILRFAFFFFLWSVCAHIWMMLASLFFCFFSCRDLRCFVACSASSQISTCS